MLRDNGDDKYDKRDKSHFPFKIQKRSPARVNKENRHRGNDDEGIDSYDCVPHGVGGGDRTHDLSVMSATLLPTELPRQARMRNKNIPYSYFVRARSVNERSDYPDY